MGLYDYFLPFQPFVKREIRRANRNMGATLRDLDRFNNIDELESSTNIFSPFRFRRNEVIGGRIGSSRVGQGNIFDDPDSSGRNRDIGFF
jgi:hypothetical protein